MIRTQVQLSEAQARKVHAAAKRQGISMAEVVRRCIDRTLADNDADLQTRYQQANKLIGRFEDKDAAKDLSRRHDVYLDEAFE